MITVFITAAGRTTATNKAGKPPSINPMKNRAIDKKMLPLIKVPTKVSVEAVTFLRKCFLASKNSKKKAQAVSGLSIRLAICPPGADVVNAEIAPVAIASRST